MRQAQRHRDYRQKIISNYQVWILSWTSLCSVLLCSSHLLVVWSVFLLQPLHRELYTLVPTVCFVPSFLKAINESTEESFRNIISEPSPGVFVFDMLQPSFCEMMLSEVMCILFCFSLILLFTFVFCSCAVFDHADRQFWKVGGWDQIPDNETKHHE